MLGGHALKSWSSNQAVLALSSGEAEYHGIVKAGSVVMGIRALAADMGMEFEKPIAIKSDASAAIGISNRIGIGKIRHIEVTQLWVQGKVASKEIVIDKVPTEENLADALTKAVEAQVIGKHVFGVNAQILCDRHPLTPKIDTKEDEIVIKGGVGARDDEEEGVGIKEEE